MLTSRSIKTHTNPLLSNNFNFLTSQGDSCVVSLSYCPCPSCVHVRIRLSSHFLTHSSMQQTISDHLHFATYWTVCGESRLLKTQPLHNATENLLETDKKSQWENQPVEWGTWLQWLQQVLGKPRENAYDGGNVFLTFSASQPRCLISRLPAMPIFPSCSRTSVITRVSRSLTLQWMAVNQAWAVAESLLLRITVCLASGEWISSCLQKQREKRWKVPWQIMLPKSWASEVN